MLRFKNVVRIGADGPYDKLIEAKDGNWVTYDDVRPLLRVVRAADRLDKVLNEFGLCDAVAEYAQILNDELAELEDKHPLSLVY